MVAQEILLQNHYPLLFDSLLSNIPRWLSGVKGSRETKAVLTELIIAENFIANKENKSELEKALLHYQSAWELIDQGKFTLSRASVKHQIGNALYRKEEYARGLEYLLRADWMMQHYGYEKFNNLGSYFANLGYAYAYYFEDFENGQYYLGMAMKNNFVNPSERYASYNFLGLLYRQNGQLDSSHYFFNIALQEAINCKDSISVGEITGNIGMNYFIENKYEKAIQMLQTNYHVALQHSNWTSAALSNIIITRIDLKQGNMTDARRKVALTRILVDSIRTTGTSKALYLASFNMYSDYLDIAKWDQDERLIMGIQDTLLAYKDSLYSTRDIKTALKIQINLIKETSEAQISLLKSEESKKIWIRNFIILLCIILSLIMVRYIYRLKLRSQRDQEKITGYLNSITEKNRILKHYEHKIEEEKSKSKNLEQNASVNTLAGHLQFLRTAAIHTEEEWAEFVMIFEKVYPGFFKDISEKIPNISPTEIRFLALTKLNIPSREMAQRLGIAMDSVRKLRYRLRKKIEHNLKIANQDIFDFNI